MAQIFKAFVKNPEKVSYEGRDKDEEILYIIRRSRLVLFPPLAAVFIGFVLPAIIFPTFLQLNQSAGNPFKPAFITSITMFWYLFMGGLLLLTFINWYFNLFIITSKKIVDIDVRGILYKNISEAALRNVEDVTSTVRGTLGTIFNIGEVFMQTAGEQMEFEFDQVDNPEFVRDTISDLVSNLKAHDHNN